MLKPLLSLTAAALAALSAGAASAQNYSDVADVVSVRPIYAQGRPIPRQQCWDETVTSSRRVVTRPSYVDHRYHNDYRYYDGPHASGAGTVLGAVVGGLVGRQFGNSNRGRNTGTVVGALVGGAIGNHAEHHNRYYYDSYRPAPARVDYVPETRTVQRCETVYEEGQSMISGYDVTYRHNGREYTTRMDHDPGPTLRVNVNVRPQGGRRTY